MNYKPIKAIKDFNNYEMSEDGQIIREVSTGKELDIFAHNGKTGTGVKLVSDDGKTIKLHGLATLYRHSWYRGYPGIENTTPRKKKSSYKSVFKVRKKQLLSEHAKKEITRFMVGNRDKGHYLYSQLIRDRTNDVTFVLLNQEKDSAIIKIKSQSWRDGYWFYNYKTELYEKFEDAKHRKDGLKGDKNLLWPDLQEKEIS